MFGEYQPTEPSRFLGEIPAELSSASRQRGTRHTRAPSATIDYEFRTNPYARKGRGRARETETPYAYEHEDQSATGLRIGMRVRHQLFGVGTVIAVEEHNDDLKVTVRFTAVGVRSCCRSTRSWSRRSGPGLEAQGSGNPSTTSWRIA